MNRKLLSYVSSLTSEPSLSGLENESGVLEKQSITHCLQQCRGEMEASRSRQLDLPGHYAHYPRQRWLVTMVKTQCLGGDTEKGRTKKPLLIVESLRAGKGQRWPSRLLLCRWRKKICTRCDGGHTVQAQFQRQCRLLKVTCSLER